MATVQKRSRQSRALDMLEAQLKSGVKTEKKTKDVKVPLTDSDRRRIEKEMEVLKSKLV
jgi:NAD(P)H-dependent FMN reductase